MREVASVFGVVFPKDRASTGAMTTDHATYTDKPLSEALEPGSKLLSGQYEIIRYLSSGGFGITYLARDSLNRTVVIKECFPEAFCSRVNCTVRARAQNYVDDFRSVVQLFIREAHALSRLKHESVVGVHQVFEDNETAYMALDLVDGKDLLDIIESGEPRLQPKDIRNLTLRVLDAIAHVHDQDLLHRDISPDNILLDASGRPVLIDFGAAREEASRKSRVLSAVLVVKDGYSPQEFYVAGSQQLPCSDLYAFAATLVHLITGSAPPNSQARLSALASGQGDLYQPLRGRCDGYDDAFLAAVDKAMNIVPADRIQSAEDWAMMIDHKRRVEAARARAEHDKSIDQTVMKLVKSTNSQPIMLSPKTGGAPVRSNDRTPAVEQLTDTLQHSKQVEDLTPDPAAQKLYLRVAAATENPSTPYIRVKSKAVAAEAEKHAMREAAVPEEPTRMSRFATVPIVFCAYFLYTHLVLQIDAVHAATVQPIVALGQELGGMRRSDPTVNYRRGGLN